VHCLINLYNQKKTSYNEYNSLLLNYSLSGTQHRNFSYWEEVSKSYFYTFQETGDPQSDGKPVRSTHPFSPSLRNLLTRYNSQYKNLYSLVLLAVLHGLKRVTGRSEGFIKVVTHARHVPKAMKQFCMKDINIYDTVGSFAFTTVEKFSLTGDNFQEQLGSITEQSKGAKDYGIDYLCLMNSKEGNEILKKIAKNASIVFNFVVADKLHIEGNDISITVPPEKERVVTLEWRNKELHPLRKDPSREVEILWFPDMVSVSVSPKYHSVQVVGEFVEEVCGLLLLWLGNHSKL